MKKWAVLAVLLITAATMSAGAALAAGPVTITGEIANFDLVKKTADQGTRLQLIPITKDNKITLTVMKGKLVFKSPIPGRPLPDKPAFTLMFKSLEPGRYLLAVQPLGGSQHTSVAVEKPGKNKIFEVPADAKGPLTFSIGKITFPIKQGM